MSCSGWSSIGLIPARRGAAFLGLAFLLLGDTLSFSSPKSKRPHWPPVSYMRQIGHGGRQDNDVLYHRLDWKNMNTTDGIGSHQTVQSFSEDSDQTWLEWELWEGYIEHQSAIAEATVAPTSMMEDNDITVGVTAAKSFGKSPDPSDAWKARFLLLLSAALYGTNFTLVKSLNESMSVGISSTLRFGFAALVMLPQLLKPIDEELKAIVKERKKSNASENHGYVHNKESGALNTIKQLLDEPTRLSAGLAGIEIGLYNSVGYISQAIGLKTTTASKSAFICSMAVVIVPILDKIWGKEILRRQIVGALMAAVGVYALEMGGQDSTVTEGDLLSLVQPIMFGIGFWRMEAAMEKFPTEAGRLAAGQLLAVFLMSLSYVVCQSPVAVDGLLLSDTCEVIPTASEMVSTLRDGQILGALLWTGVVTTAFTIWMETLALKTLSAAETTVIFSTEPLFGAAFAAVVAHEYFGVEAGVGAFFILGGCLVSGMDWSSLLENRDAR